MPREGPVLCHVPSSNSPLFLLPALKRPSPRITQKGCWRAAQRVWHIVKKVSKHPSTRRLAEQTYRLRGCLHKGYGRIQNVKGLASAAAMQVLPTRWELTLQSSEYEERLVYEAAVKDLCNEVARYAREPPKKVCPERPSSERRSVARPSGPRSVLDLGDDLLRLVLEEACYQSYARSLLVPGIGAAKCRLVCANFARCGKALIQARQAAVVEDVCMHSPTIYCPMSYHYMVNLASDGQNHVPNGSMLYGNCKLGVVAGPYLSQPPELEAALANATQRCREKKEAQIRVWLDGPEGRRLRREGRDGRPVVTEELLWVMARALLRTASHSKRSDFCRSFSSFVENCLLKDNALG